MTGLAERAQPLAAAHEARRRRRLGEGSPFQRLLFALLVGLPLIGVSLATVDKLQRLGQPNVGWLMDGRYVSPTRRDTSEAGLRGGGRALRINGVDVPSEVNVEPWTPPL